MKKFFSYLLTFAVLFVMAATGTIFLSITDGDNGSVPLNVDVEGAEEVSFFSGLLGSFEKNKQFNINGDLVVEYEDNKLPIYVYANIDIADEHNVKVEGFLTANLTQDKISVSFGFYNQVIYLSFKDFNLKIKLSDIENLKNSIGELIGVLGFDLENDFAIESMLDLDMNNIMMSLNNITTQTLKNGDTKNALIIQDLVAADIVVGSDELIKSVSLATEEIMGIKISADLNIDYNNDILISNPENNNSREYIDVINLLDFAKNLINLNNFDLSFTFDIENEMLNGYISSVIRADILNGEFEWHVYDTNFKAFSTANLTYKSGNLYLNIDDVWVLLSKDVISQAPGLIKFIVSNYLNDISLDDVIKNYNFDLSIIFDVLNNIDKAKFDESGFYIKYAENVIEAKIENNMLSEINLSCDVFDTKINFSAIIEKSERMVDIDDSEKYLDLYKVYQSNLEFLSSLKFDLSMSSLVEEDGVSYSLLADALIDLKENYYSIKGLQTLNKNYKFDVVFENDIAFVNINNCFIKCDKDRLEDLLKLYDVDLNQEVQENINQIVTESLENYNGYTLDDYISKIDSLKKIEINSDKILIAVDLSQFDIDARGTAELTFENNIISKLNLTDFDYAGKYFGNIEIIINSNDFQKEEIDYSQYLDLFAVYDDINGVIALDQATYYADVKVKYFDKSIGTYLKFAYNKDNGYFDLNGRFNIDDMLKTFDFSFYDQKLFANFEDIYVQVGKDNLEKLMSLFLGHVDLNQFNPEGFTEIIKGFALTQNIQSFTENLSVQSLDLIRNITINHNCIKLTIVGNMLGLKSDIFLIINLNDSTIKDIEIINLQLDDNISISFKIALYRNKVRTLRVDEDKYIDIFETAQDILALKDLTHAGLTFDANIEFMGNVYGANLEGYFDLDKNYYKLAGLVNYKDNKFDIGVDYYNEEAYIKFEQVYFKLAKEKIDESFGLLSQNINFGDFNRAEVLRKIFSMKLFNTLKELINNFKYEDIENLKLLALNSEEFVVVIDKSILQTQDDFKLKLKFNEGMFVGIEILNLELDDEIKGSFKLALDRNEVEIARVEEEKYLDVFGLIDDALSLKELRRASLSLDADVIYNGDVYGANIDGAFNLDTNYYNIAGLVNYKGENIDIALAYLNVEAYIKFQDIYVKANKENIDRIIALISDKVSFDSIETTSFIDRILSMKLVNTVNELFANFTEDDVKAIKHININSKEIKLLVDKSYIDTSEDLLIILSLDSSKISAIEIDNLELDDEIKGSFKLALDRNEVEIARVDEEKYLDVFALIDNLKNLENATSLNASIDFDLSKLVGQLYESEFAFSGNISKQLLGEKLSSLADVCISYRGNTFNLNGKLEDSTIFADLNGFKIRIDSDKVLYTLHKILGLADMDTDKYDDIITRILEVFGGKAISSAFDGYDFGDNIETQIRDFKEQIDIDFDKLLNQIITNVKIDAENIVLTIDTSCIGFDRNINLVISLINNNISYLEVQKLEIADKYIDLKLSLDQNPVVLDDLTEAEKVPYLDIKELADLAEITYDTIKNGSVSGVVKFDFKFNGNVNHIVANYGLKISDKKLTAFMTTTFNGLNINIYYVDGVFYIDLGGVSNSADNRLQIKATFEEHEALFAWLDDQFGFDVLEEIRMAFGMEEKLDLNHIRSVIRGETGLDFSLDEILNMIANFDLGFIQSAIFTDGQLQAALSYGIDIGCFYDDVVNRVTLGYDKDQSNGYKYYVDLTCVDFDDIVLDNIDNGNYVSYTVITDAISAVMNTVKEDPLAFFAELSFFENNKKSDRYLKLGYQDDKFFADYYGLKISMARNSLSQVLSMALEVLGFDPNIASLIGEVADTSEIDLSNMQASLPAIDLGNPFTMLRYLKSISLKNGVFTIIIDSELFNSTTGKDFEIKLSTANGRITKLEVNNIYTSAQNNAYINASIVFERGVASSAYSSYIDLSNSVDLIKAFLNTSQLNDYLVQGKVMLSVSSINAAKVDIDFRVKLDENKKPIMVLTVSNYPMIVEVNDANTNERGGTLTQMRYRSITVYFKDGEMYLKTFDDAYQYKLGFITMADYDSYERITRITPGYFIDNIKYYLNWILGFTSLIQNKIDEAIDVSLNYNGNDDYSNIILSYSKSGNSHYIKLNLQKIAHNDDIGELSITLTTTNNSSTGYKDYLYAMDLDLKMLDNLLSLKTDSSNKLYLKNIGQAVDIASARNFINNYPYNPYGEYAKEGSGSYSQKNSKTITVTLNRDGGTGVSSLSGNLGSNMTLPTPTKVIDNGITKTTYTFLGWFDSDGKICTLTYFPPKNMTLTAHWEVASVQYYKTLIVKNNNGASDKSIKQLQYTSVNISALSDYVIDNGVTRKSYTFLGWSLSGVNIGKNVTVNLDDNKTIEGLWNEEVVYYRTATFDSDGGTSVNSNKQLEGTVISLPIIAKATYDDGIVNIVYTFVGWSDGVQTCAGGTSYTLANDVKFTAIFGEYVREYHTIKIVNDMLEINQTVKELNDHEVYVLPVHETQIVEHANVRYYFNFIGYLNQENDVITQYDFSRDIIATANYVEDVSRREYISTLTIYNYDNSILSQETKTNGEIVELPLLPEVIETEEIVNGRAYQVIRNFIGYSENLIEMPNYDVDIYAIYEEVSRKAYYMLNVYDINTSTGEINNSLVSTRLFEGESIPYPTLSITAYDLTLNGETGRYEFNGWDKNLATMPASDLVIKATYLTYYTLTFYDINSSNGQITRQLSSTKVLVGSDISYPTISTTSYRINNSDGSYKIYTYTGWNNSSTTMPNKNLTISATYSVTTYYKVQFNVSWYKPSWWITSGTIKSSPTAPATQYIAAGTQMNLSGYSATIKVKYGITYTYKTKGWSTSKASNSTSAVNKVTVNSNLTLYAVWDH